MRGVIVDDLAAHSRHEATDAGALGLYLRNGFYDGLVVGVVYSLYLEGVRINHRSLGQVYYIQSYIHFNDQLHGSGGRSGLVDGNGIGGKHYLSRYGAETVLCGYLSQLLRQQ